MYARESQKSTWGNYEVRKGIKINYKQKSY